MATWTRRAFSSSSFLFLVAFVVLSLSHSVISGSQVSQPVLPGKSIGPIMIGMDWQTAKRLFSQFGPFKESETLDGLVLQSGWGSVSDYVVYYDQAATVRTPQKVAQIGTVEAGFVLRGRIKVGSSMSEVFAIYGRPDAERFGAYQWLRLGLEIEPTLKGKGDRVGWIGVFVPKK